MTEPLSIRKESQLPNRAPEEGAVADAIPAAPAESRPPANAEIKKLLGPLVDPLLRDAQGDLDLTKVNAQSLEEFQEFLQTQVSVDGISFNQHLLGSYQKVLGRPVYEPLLRALWEEKLGGAKVLDTAASAATSDLVQAFTAEIVAVSADRFVRHHFSSKDGRERLRHILGDASHYTTHLRADVVKAIASAADTSALAGLHRRQAQHRLNGWNYLNIGVEEGQVREASEYAQEILGSADYLDAQQQKIRHRYLQHPEQVSVPLAGEKILPEHIQSHFKIYEESRQKSDPLNQVRAKLANFWLLVADNANWRHEEGSASFEERARLLVKIEAFLKQAGGIRDEADFVKFNEALNDFLRGPLNRDGKTALNWIKHQTVGDGLEEIFQGMPTTAKAPYQEILQFSDEIHHAVAMGEKIRLRKPAPDSEKKEIQASVQSLVEGLEKTKRGLWYGYKQHKLLSRGLSQVADLADQGDVADIRRANSEIDRMIERLEQAKDLAELKREIDHLYKLLKKDGSLHRAFEAAEMDGTEQILGLVQTVAVILATTVATDGLGTAAAVGNAMRVAGTLKNFGSTVAAVRAARAAAGAARAVEAATLGEKVVHGIKTGMTLSVAENAVAVVSGEVRTEKDTILKWLKDAVATGAAMGLVTPFAGAAGEMAHQHVLKRLMQRYLTTGVDGALRFLGDTGLEAIEEVADQYVRQRLDGKTEALTWDELREITSICLAGGGAKIGAVVQGFRGAGIEAKIEKGETDGPAAQFGPWSAAMASGLSLLAAACDGDGDIRSADPSWYESIDWQSPWLKGIALLSGLGIFWWEFRQLRKSREPQPTQKPKQTIPPPAVTITPWQRANPMEDVTPLSLGGLFREARRLFVDQGLPEARVSLREGQRLKQYLETFGKNQDYAQILAKALWLILGASLTQEQREGELGRKLHALFLRIQMPLDERLRFQSSLESAIQAKEVKFDATKHQNEALLTAAFRGSLISESDPLSMAKLIVLFRSDLGLEILQKLCGDSDPEIRRLVILTFRKYWLEFTMEQGGNDLGEPIGHLSQEERREALKILERFYGSTGPLVQNSIIPALDALLPLFSEAERLEALNALQSGFDHEDSDRRQFVASTILELTQHFSETESLQVLKTLELLVADSEGRVRDIATSALRAILMKSLPEFERHRTFKTLLGMAVDPHVFVRNTIAHELHFFFWYLSSAEREEALGVLKAACVDPEEMVRDSAKRTLIVLGKSSSQVRAWLQRQLQPSIARYEELGRNTPDQAARILPNKGDFSDLEANLEVFAGVMNLPVPTLLQADPDFDPKLVAAHQLLNRVSQALAINRFALVSGPPASGKSEVGRYLGKAMGWRTVVFNANRNTSQEDVMQKIGVVANGSTKFTITDGHLVDALIHGKLFILNEINLAKPGSLAFLFSILADVNQDFDFYDPASGKTERRKIHPNFRLLATQNLDGPGRKDLNAALKNRAIEIAAPAYGDVELIALLRSRYPAFTREGNATLAVSLVRFYGDMSAKIASRAIGWEGEGYVWNLRHLMRLAEGFSKLEGKTTASQVLQVLDDEVGLSLLPRDREVFFDAVRNYEYNGVKIGEGDVKQFIETFRRRTLKAVYEEFGIERAIAESLAKKQGILDISTSARFLRMILKALKAGYFPDGKQKIGFKQVPSPLVQALRDSDSKLAVCLLDEAAFARPDVLEELNSLLDRDGGIWIVDGRGRAQFLKRRKNFRMILASNTYGYGGVNLQSEALRSRTQEIFMDFEFSAEEIAVLLGEGREALASALVQARQLFIDHDFPEARVSLREVQRLKQYLETFGKNQDPTQVLAKALWLILGAGLTQEHREGALGQKLHALFLKIPRGVEEQGKFQGALDAATQVKEVKFDSMKDFVGALLSASFQGTFAKQLHFLTLVKLVGLIRPEIALENLLTLSKDSEPVVRAGVVDVLRELGKNFFIAQEPVVSSILRDLRSDQNAMVQIKVDIFYKKVVENGERLQEISVTSISEVPPPSETKTKKAKEALQFLQNFVMAPEGTDLRYATRDLDDLFAYLSVEERVDALKAFETVYRRPDRFPETDVAFAIRNLFRYSPEVKRLEILNSLQNQTNHQDLEARRAAGMAIFEAAGYFSEDETKRVFETLRRMSDDLEPEIRRYAIDAMMKVLRFLSEPQIRRATKIVLIESAERGPNQRVAIWAMEKLVPYLLERDHEEVLASVLRLCADSGDLVNSFAGEGLFRLAQASPQILDLLRLELKPAIDRYEDLSRNSPDRAARIAPHKGEFSDLEANLEVFGGVLNRPAPFVLPAHPDFDPSLVTAHQLLNRLTQALAINRFALLSGPPASGKSEVGRYLAEILGWECVVFNANRQTSQEDMMQKIGVVANGTTSFTITDGPLAEALLQGKLFLFNEINLAKPGNLAFLFSILADVNQEFDYYDPSTGKTERRAIHPNFRMVATQNPEGPGRKDLNAALKNRAIEIAAPAYGDVELIALLRGKFPVFQEAKASSLAQELVCFHQDMANRIASRAMGEGEGYVWNLRHLVRLAEGFAAAASLGKDLRPLQILEIMQDRVGVAMRPKDRAGFFDAVRNYAYFGVSVTEGDLQNFTWANQHRSFSEIYEEFQISPESADSLAKKHGVVDIPTSAKFLRSILVSLKAGYSPWLKGPAGTGKTKLAAFAAELLGANLYLDTLTPQTDESQLKGELKPTLITLPDGAQRLGFRQVPSALVLALRDDSKKLSVALLDEAAFAKPDVLEELNSLLDRDGGLWIVDAQGKAEFLERPKNFRLILASNTYGYGGVSLQSEALRSRVQEIFMDFEFSPSEVAKLLGDGAKTLAPALGAAREFFSGKGLGESRVSLREVRRLKDYMEIFGPGQDEAKTAANALWLSLGASLAPEQREGELGQGLKSLILGLGIFPGSEEKFSLHLDAAVQAKTVEFDASKHSSWQLWDKIVRRFSKLRFVSLTSAIDHWIQQVDGMEENRIWELLETVEQDAIFEIKVQHYMEIGLKAAGHPKVLEEIVRRIEESSLDPSEKLYYIARFAKNLEAPEAKILELFEGLMDSRAPLKQIAENFSLGFHDFALSVELFASFMEKVEMMGDADWTKLDPLEVISRCRSLTSAHLEIVLEYLYRLAPSHPNRAAAALGQLAGRPNLSERQLAGIQHWLETMNLDTNHWALAWGHIGAARRVPAKVLEKLLSGKVESVMTREVLVSLSRSPEASSEDVSGYIREILSLEANFLAKAEDLGMIGGHSIQVAAVIQALLPVFLDPTVPSFTQDRLLITAAKNPHHTEESLRQMIEVVRQSSWSESRKQKILLEMAYHPKLARDDFSKIVVDDEVLPLPSFVSDSFLRGFLSDPRRDSEFLQKQIEVAEQGGPMTPDREAFVRRLYSAMLGNPNLSAELFGDAMALETKTLPRDLKAFSGRAAKQYYEDYVRQIETAWSEMKKLKDTSVDALARLIPEKGDETDLETHLTILSGLLGRKKTITTSSDPDFDPTLVSAHQLLNRLTQSLAINRFALLSGPPASGKSEVGRYLAKVLDWDCVVFNANRNTSKEDMMQKIGVVAKGKTQFTVSDGPLADALIQGKLFLFNEINLAKPGNLAFLFSLLTDVNQEFDYYDPATGKMERRAIHPNFKMVATQNPEGPGRKELNAALKNRAIEIAAPAYGDLELVALLRGKFPHFQKKEFSDLPA
ncbi:MAG: AAA family ATPase, partial [Deltaproteobacteria bacterium]|nr:AAA family ATPase [Deltaproteobacteria bacterium]